MRAGSPSLRGRRLELNESLVVEHRAEVNEMLPAGGALLESVGRPSALEPMRLHGGRIRGEGRRGLRGRRARDGDGVAAEAALTWVERKRGWGVEESVVTVRGTTPARKLAVRGGNGGGGSEVVLAWARQPMPRGGWAMGEGRHASWKPRKLTGRVSMVPVGQLGSKRGGRRQLGSWRYGRSGRERGR